MGSAARLGSTLLASSADALTMARRSERIFIHPFELARHFAGIGNGLFSFFEDARIPSYLLGEIVDLLLVAIDLILERVEPDHLRADCLGELFLLAKMPFDAVHDSRALAIENIK